MTKTGGIRILRPNKAFRQALVIKQVGAEPLRTPRGTVFKLGGGIFSKRQIIGSRKRWARTYYPKAKFKW